MFAGVMAGAAIAFSSTTNTDMSDTSRYGSGSFNGGAYFGMDFGLVTGQVELLLAQDNARMYVKIGNGSSYYWETIKVNGTSLLVPLIAKLDFHLGPVVLQPLLGPYLNFGLGKLNTGNGSDPYANPLLGIMFGGAVGMKLGSGMIFLDTRYAADLGKTKAGNQAMKIWERSALRLNLGYQFNFGDNK
jgi:hypothetical protein